MKISVLMSNYNTNKSMLKDCIDSVLSQTLGDFEFIIIDDASTNESVNIIKSYKDERIVLIENSERKGLTKNLNRALDIAKGEYIARMDADDICLPNRFEIQYRFMKKHKDYIACGSNVKVFGNRDYVTGAKNMPLEARRCSLIYSNNCVPHPTLFADRKQLLKYGIKYNEKYIKSQDFGLWQSLTKHGNIYCIKKPLVMYRVHEKQISNEKEDSQIEYSNCVKLDNIKRLNVDLDSHQKEQFVVLDSYTLLDKKTLVEVVKRIYNANIKAGEYSYKYLKHELNYIWIKATKSFKNTPFKCGFGTIWYVLNRDYFSRLNIWK